MADALDLGFRFSEHPENGGTFTYDWATDDDSGCWHKRQGPADRVYANHEFYVSLFDLSETPDVDRLDVEITFALTAGNILAPVVGWPAPSDGRQVKLFEGPPQPGTQNGYSAGLQANGTYWGLGPFRFNTALLQRECTYEVSIVAGFQDEGTEQSYSWSVDPELVIGGRG